MNAYRVIRHPGDEDEGARWACRARQQRGPVEILEEMFTKSVDKRLHNVYLVTFLTSY